MDECEFKFLQLSGFYSVASEPSKCLDLKCQKRAKELAESVLTETSESPDNVAMQNANQLDVPLSVPAGEP